MNEFSPEEIERKIKQLKKRHRLGGVYTHIHLDNWAKKNPKNPVVLGGKQGLVILDGDVAYKQLWINTNPLDPLHRYHMHKVLNLLTEDNPEAFKITFGNDVTDTKPYYIRFVPVTGIRIEDRSSYTMPNLGANTYHLNSDRAAHITHHLKQLKHIDVDNDGINNFLVNVKDRIVHCLEPIRLSNKVYDLIDNIQDSKKREEALHSFARVVAINSAIYHPSLDFPKSFQSLIKDAEKEIALNYHSKLPAIAKERKRNNVGRKLFGWARRALRR